jgi:hypothetical protein
MDWYSYPLGLWKVKQYSYQIGKEKKKPKHIRNHLVTSFQIFKIPKLAK